MPKSSLSPLILPKQTNLGKKERQTHTSSMPTLMDDQPQMPSLLHANSPYQTSLDLISRPRSSMFGIEKKKGRESSKPTLKDSGRLEDALDKTKTMLTNSKTFSATQNCPLRYGLCSKICLPAQYLLTMQIEPGNYNENSIQLSNSLLKLRPTLRMLSCKGLTQFKPLNAFK
jgi:hypothetical protein